MPFTVGWPDVALRLVVTLIAGALVGLNRGGSGKVAGLRTTLLVCLAARLAMLPVNVLLAQSGKPNDSFVMLDLMRLPLGILSGVGFIGAGAILRNDGLVIGLTTAATLWFVTVIGLCAGGGQIGLAVAGLALALVVLWVLGKLEHRLPRGKHAWLSIEYDPATGDRGEVIRRLEQQHCQVDSSGLAQKEAGRLVEERFDIYGVRAKRAIRSSAR